MDTNNNTNTNTNTNTITDTITDNSLHTNLDKYKNLCISCGVDIGYDNPRQYCCKTYCPFPSDEFLNKYILKTKGISDINSVKNK